MGHERDRVSTLLQFKWRTFYPNRLPRRLVPYRFRSVQISDLSMRNEQVNSHPLLLLFAVCLLAVLCSHSTHTRSSQKRASPHSRFASVRIIKTESQNYQEAKVIWRRPHRMPPVFQYFTMGKILPPPHSTPPGDRSPPAH